MNRRKGCSGQWEYIAERSYPGELNHIKILRRSRTWWLVVKEWPARQEETREEPCREARRGQLCRKRLVDEPWVTERSGRTRLGVHLGIWQCRELCDGCYTNTWVDMEARTQWPIEWMRDEGVSREQTLWRHAAEKEELGLELHQGLGLRGCSSHLSLCKIFFLGDKWKRTFVLIKQTGSGKRSVQTSTLQEFWVCTL